MEEVFEMILSLNQYKSHHIVNPYNIKMPKYLIKVSYGIADYYHNGGCSLKLLTDGEAKDVELNNWVFSPISQGVYHYPKEFGNIIQYINSTIKCLSPQREELDIPINTNKKWEMGDFAELYLNTILFLSNFRSIEEYRTIQDLEQSRFTVYSIQETIERSHLLLRVQSLIEEIQKKESFPKEFIESIKRTFNKQFECFKSSVSKIQLNY